MLTVNAFSWEDRIVFADAGDGGLIQTERALDASER
jgi:hypothetical protein